MFATQEFSPRYPPEPITMRNLEAARSGLVSLSILIDQHPDIVRAWSLEYIRSEGMRLAVIADIGYPLIITGLTFADVLAKLHTQLAARSERASSKEAA